MTQKWMVGIRFDDNLEGFLAYLQSFQKQTGSVLHLVHAIEPWSDDAWLSSYVGADLYAAVAKDAEIQAFEASEKKLKQLRVALHDELTELSTVIGPAHMALTQKAKDTGASGIIVGVGGSYELLPRGFSTAVSLMARPEFPCLAVPHSSRLFCQSNKLKAAVLDDFRPDSLGFLSGAERWLSGLTGHSIHHLHVSEKTDGGVQHFFQNLARLGKSLPSGEASAETSDVAAGEKLLEMRQENAGIQSAVEARHYLNGKASEVLANYAKEQSIDLVVAGRHKRVHTSPFGIGRFSFAMLVHLGLPIAVLPDGWK